MEKTAQSVKNKIIFVCGKTRSGKTYLSKKLATTLNYDFVEVSSIVKEILSANKRSELVNKPELDFQIIQQIKLLSEQSNILVSGVRQLSIIESFPEAQVLWLHTPQKVREQWFTNDLETRSDDLSLSQIDETDKKLHLSSILEYIFNKDK